MKRKATAAAAAVFLLAAMVTATSVMAKMPSNIGSPASYNEPEAAKKLAEAEKEDETEAEAEAETKTKTEAETETAENDIIKNYYGLTGRSVPETVIAEDGTVFVLEDVTYRVDEFTAEKTYRDYEKQPEIPEKYNFTVNGKTVDGTLVSIESDTSEAYCVPFTVTGKFYGDSDCLYYQMEDNLIPAETTPLFEAYSEVLLEYLGLDPEIYRIDTGEWVSEYPEENDDTVKTAEYSGMRKVKTYTALYEGATYSARAVYRSKTV